MGRAQSGRMGLAKGKRAQNPIRRLFSLFLYRQSIDILAPPRENHAGERSQRSTTMEVDGKERKKNSRDSGK